MARRQKQLKVPFARRIDDEETRKRLKRDVERVDAIRCEAYEICAMRFEFEIETLKKDYKLSEQAASYLRQGYSPFHAIRSDKSETDFKIWMENYSSSHFDDALSIGKELLWENRIITLAAYLLPKHTREEWEL